MFMANPQADNKTAVTGPPDTRKPTSCGRKKVKCDGKQPCSDCAKNGADRLAKSVRSSSRRTESPGGSVLALRVRQYEHLLRAHGIDLGGEGPGQPYDPMEDDDPTSRPGNLQRSALGDRVSSNHCTLTQAARKEAQIELTLYETGPGNVDPPGGSAAGFDAENSTTPELLIWGRPNFVPLRPMHPTVPQVMLLWHTFLSNFDPLVKLFHAPTAQITVSNAATDLDSIAPSTEALMFAIYLSATATMTEQQCVRLLETSKPMLVKRFANATQQALVNARFLKSSDPVVLQALTLYLLAARSYIDKQALWILAGIAARLGETMGLNEESHLKSLSPFEAEMRRRLWSQIYLLNGCPVRRRGNDDSTTRSPSNCNDSDLSPSMAKLPGDRGRGTEMVFCELHRGMGSCLSRLKLGEHDDLASRLDVLAEFQSKLEQMTLNCDPSIPLHLFTVLVGRSVAAQLHFTVQTNAHSSRSLETEPNILVPRVSLLEDAIEILAKDAELRSTQALLPFLWHPVVQFPFAAFVFVLQELRGGLNSEERSTAWIAVNQVYEDHPQFVTHGENPLHTAAGDLAVRAWDRTVEVGAGDEDRGDFEDPIESHALRRLREQRTLYGVVSTVGERDLDAKAEELEWAGWQQMLHDAGHWQGFLVRT